MRDANLQLAVERFLAAQLYFPCCLLLNLDVVRLQEVRDRMVAQYHWPVVSLDSTLSKAMVNITPKRRPSKASDIVNQAIQQQAPGPVLCTDVDVLFEPELELDPLGMLREASRIAPLVVTWPGSYSNGALAYARPEHMHYHVWHAPELSATCAVAV